MARAAVLTLKVSINLLLPPQKFGPCVPFFNLNFHLVILCSRTSHQPLFVIFFLFKNIPLHFSSSLFFPCTESTCVFNEALVLFF